MIINSSRIKLAVEYDRVSVLHWLHFGFMSLGIASEAISNGALFGGLVKIIILLSFYFYYFKTVTKLYYTFWTFSTILALVLIYSIITSSGPGTFYAYFLALICLGIEAFILSSPIYYQLVRWWEYDFRFREDIKGTAQIGDVEKEIRLTDLRRGAGCVTMFADVEIGKKMNLVIRDQDIECEIMSKRRYAIGRPYIYGVKFDMESVKARVLFEKFQDEWQKDLKEKRKKKLSKEKMSESK